MNYKNLLILKQPANTEGQMWKTALPLGNGITGALVYGAVSEETIVVTRHDLWGDRQINLPLPDISDCLNEARKLIDAGDYPGANDLMQDRLQTEGYDAETPTAFPLGALSLKSKFNTGMFKKYRRGIDMEQGEVFVNWMSGNRYFERKSFVSRADGILYTHVKHEGAERYELSFDFCDHHNGQAEAFIKSILPSMVKEVKDGILYFTAKMGETLYGALISVDIHDDGNYEADESGTGLIIISADYTVKLLSFAKLKGDETVASIAAKLKEAPSYKEALEKHSALHSALFCKTTLQLSKEDDSHYTYSNEELLAEAYEDVGSSVLYEKLWKFGRYLFISGTASDSNPFSLYGIWSGDYNLPWNQNVCNQNIEMIYWHILSGNLAELMKPMIRYYCRRLDCFRENAQKLFGCRGIYVPTYTAPETMNGDDGAPPAPCVAVVLNWISAAGWLSYQFYQYYQYTKDEELMEKEILPFMIETARFYADYAVYDQNGKIRIYPSVSPENTPKNFLSDDCAGEDYLPNPVAENATMDFAILKVLLTNLLTYIQTGKQDIQVDEEEKQEWKKLLQSIPDYKINEDGALQEWISDTLKDNYFHRHFSHIFPLFPGEEIDPLEKSDLREAVEKAVDLRETNSQSGWAFAHSACIMARLQRGEAVFRSLDMMAKSCLFPNFFTAHNDWRHMGVSMYLDKMNAPIQFDALMGSMNAMQEMLFQYRDNRLAILPARSKRLDHISAKGLKFPGGEVSLTFENDRLAYTVCCECDMVLEILLPSKRFTLNCRKMKKYSFEEDFKALI